jgi:tetratricopeptide (TPR) repeat protein
VYLADALDASGRPEETLKLLQPNDKLSDDPYELASGAHARALIGDREGAQRTLDRMLLVNASYEVPRYLIAYARLASGDARGALDDLESAVREDPGWMMVLEHDPALVELHSERRFQRLISQRPNAIG